MNVQIEGWPSPDEFFQATSYHVISLVPMQLIGELCREPILVPVRKYYHQRFGCCVGHQSYSERHRLNATRRFNSCPRFGGWLALAILPQVSPGAIDVLPLQGNFFSKSKMGQSFFFKQTSPMIRLRVNAPFSPMSKTDDLFYDRVPLGAQHG